MTSKVLIAYFSRTGNVEKIAKRIQAFTGGDIFQIVPQTAYPSDYPSCTALAKKEKAERARPAIKGDVPNVSNYDIIFVGSPIWWGTCAAPVFTFLESQDFTGKFVVPFCTHGGGGKETCFSDIAAACRNAKPLEGLEVYESTAEKNPTMVQSWLEKVTKIQAK